MDSSYEEIEDEYETAVEDKRKKDSIKLQQWWFMTFVNSLEYANSAFNPFDINLDGWGEQVSEDIDSYEEIARVAAAATRHDVVVDVLVRVTVGVEAHTHEFIATAHEDQKFGLSLSTGAAAEAIRRIVKLPSLNLVGLHSHIGSQIFDEAGFEVSAHRLVGLAAAVRAELGATPLDARLGSAEVAALFLRLQALLLAPAPPRWEALLLPPPEADGRLLVEAAARGGDDARLLAALLRETREALGGAAFEAAARGALEEAGRSLLSTLAPARAEGPKPLAKLVPAVAAASEAVLRAAASAPVQQLQQQQQAEESEGEASVLARGYVATAIASTTASNAM
jgi:hypothetical protein